jgi:hypothetical protein
MTMIKTLALFALCVGACAPKLIDDRVVLDAPASEGFTLALPVDMNSAWTMANHALSDLGLKAGESTQQGDVWVLFSQTPSDFFDPGNFVRFRLERLSATETRVACYTRRMRINNHGFFDAPMNLQAALMYRVLADTVRLLGQHRSERPS